MKELPATVVILLLAVSLHAAAQVRFTTNPRLATGQTIVLAESDSDARSTGSLSARLSGTASPPDENTCFTSGRICPREGVIEKVVIADLDDDPQSGIIIIASSVGTGDSLSARALTFCCGWASSRCGPPSQPSGKPGRGIIDSLPGKALQLITDAQRS
jgi:hypothetical protein